MVKDDDTMKYIHYIIIISFIASTLLQLGERNNFVVEVSFAAIILYTVASIFKSGLPSFCLYKMFHLFCLFFFGIAPLLQFKSKIRLWNANAFSDTDYIITNVILLMLLFVFNVIYENTNSKFRQRISLKSTMSDTREFNISKWRTTILAVISLFCLFFIFQHNGFSIPRMLFRGIAGETFEQGNQIAGHFVSKFIRPMPIIIFLYYGMCNNSKTAYKILFLILGVLTQFPTSVARLQAAALYIPLVLFLIPILRKGNNFVTAMVLGLLAVFPFLNNFRFFDASNEIKFGLNFDMFYQGHFDAYQMFMQVVSSDIITYGYQLLGALFFYVPRAMWPSKPVGSGHFMAGEVGLSFPNISMPYLAEGYINFGIVGSILFAILMGFVTKRFDIKYWEDLQNTTLRFRVQYLILLGMLFFIMRGDLLSSTAYTMGIMTSVYFVDKVAKAK